MSIFTSKITITLAAAGLLLVGCQNNEEGPVKENDQNTQQHENNEEVTHEMHSSSGEIPDELAEADNPKFPVGSKVMMHADHMPGMNNVEATIAGAFDTTAYTVTYVPKTGGEKVENHKWIVHEEIVDAEKAPLEKGTEVMMTADHMEGMEGARAIIESSKETTVYMVDFTPKDGDQEIKNHKWVTEDELSEQ